MRVNSFFLITLLLCSFLADLTLAKKASNANLDNDISFKELSNKAIIGLSVDILNNDCEKKNNLIDVIDSRVKINYDLVDQLKGQYKEAQSLQNSLIQLPAILIQNNKMNKAMLSKNQKSKFNPLTKIAIYSAEENDLVDSVNASLQQLSQTTEQDSRDALLQKLNTDIDNVLNMLIYDIQSRTQESENLNKKKAELNKISCQQVSS